MIMFAAAAQAQTMFKCQDGGRTVYSDRPCWSGTEVKRMTPSGAATPEDVARAQMKSRDQERSAAKPQPPADVAAAAKRKPSPTPAPTPTQKSAALEMR
jgi:hypothetical protein